LAALKQELSSDPGASTRRRQAARERAARDVHERAGRARAALERLAAERKSRAKTHAKDEAKKKEPRASTTDPEARSMRFPDGAVRPAYNAQIAAAPKEGVIVSIEVTDRRNDAGLAGPMVASSRSWRGSNPTQLVSLQSTRSATRCHARWRSLLSRLPAPSRTATGRAVFATARPTHKADRRPAAKLATKIYSKSRVPPRDSRIGGRSVAGGRTLGDIAVEIGVGRRTIAKWVKLDDVLDRQRCVLQSRSPLYFQGFLARR